MKKITPILAIAALAISFTSCKKDYTCTCKDSAGTQTAQYQFPKVKKSAAEDGCNTWHTAAQVSGGSCSLD